MKYTAEFYSINKKAYKIVFETSAPGGEKRLKLSGNPFTSSVKSDDKHIYSPIRCGGATVGLLTAAPEIGLYAGQAKGVKVTLFSGETSDVVEWIGYVSPTMYDQGYDEELEELQIDCIDGISVLKDIPFIMEGGHQVTSFGNIIARCLSQSECYLDLYVSDNVQLTSAVSSEMVIDKLRISTQNFADRKKDIKQTDDDVAWSCYDVLYELCQWLGYTLITEGNKVFILDYDAIVSGNNSYFHHHINKTNLGDVGKETFALSRLIEAKDYSSNGSKISLDEVYNKVTVKDEFNTYDDLFPLFGDINNETNLTGSWDSYAKDSYLWYLPPYPEMNIEGNTYLYIYGSAKDSYDACICRFYESPVFNFCKYADAGGRTDTTQNSSLWGEGNFKFSSMMASNGAFYMRMAQITIPYEKYIEWWNSNTMDVKSTWEGIAKLFGKIPDFNGVTMKPIILLRNVGDNRIGPGDGVNLNDVTDNDATKNYPFITLKDTSSSAIFGGKNHILRIKGTFRYHNHTNIPFPISDIESIPYDGDKKDGDQGYIWCKVKWGSKYWNGSFWVAIDSWFKLYYWDKEEHPGNWKNHDTYNKDFPFCSNKQTLATLGEDGYIIPAPTDSSLEGTAEVSFTTRDMHGDSRRSHWGPKGTLSDNYYCRNYSGHVFISDLSVTAEVSPGLLSDADLDSDTCYTNVIVNGSVSAMPELSFKICTDDGKKPSYSSVDVESGNARKFVTTTYNKALYSKQRDTEGCDGQLGALRQEEHMVFKLASHYEEPKLIYECNLHNDGHPLYCVYTDKLFEGKKFLITDREIDYRFNSVNLKLTEKQ